MERSGKEWEKRKEGLLMNIKDLWVMSGKKIRDKGARGATMAANLLRSRDWTVAFLTAGLSSEDFIAVDTAGVTFSVEVKNTKDILIKHVMQAKQQAVARKSKWMLMSHIHNSNAWLIQRQGERPTVWYYENN